MNEYWIPAFAGMTEVSAMTAYGAGYDEDVSTTIPALSPSFPALSRHSCEGRNPEGRNPEGRNPEGRNPEGMVQIYSGLCVIQKSTGDL